MKNLLITIVTIAAGFGITYYVLDRVFIPKNGINYVSSTESSSSESSSMEIEEDNTSSPKASSIANEMLPEDIDNYLASEENWNVYYDENIDLSSNFIALNTEGEEIDKSDFLSELTSGDFAPIKLLTGEEMYQLYELDDSQSTIAETIKTNADITYSYYTKEGTKFPDFNFVDLNGTKFTSANTAEKIIIMKCWHMNDKPSISEFATLNDLYDEYEAYEDVLFLSLAFDSASKLQKFLIKNEFRYPVIANQKNFIENTLEISHLPTHIIIDEEGYIEKMVGSVEELKEALNKMSAPDISEMNQ